MLAIAPGAEAADLVDLNRGEDAERDEKTPDAQALAIFDAVERLSASHRSAPVLAVFDEVMKGRNRQIIGFGTVPVLPGMGRAFWDLLVEAFCPPTERDRQLAESDDPNLLADAALMDEFRNGLALQAFQLRYELNGMRGREAWAEEFADEILRCGVETPRAAAVARGQGLWEQGMSTMKPVPFARYLCRRAGQS